MGYAVLGGVGSLCRLRSGVCACMVCVKEFAGVCIHGVQKGVCRSLQGFLCCQLCAGVCGVRRVMLRVCCLCKRTSQAGHCVRVCRCSGFVCSVWPDMVQLCILSVLMLSTSLCWQIKDCC
jgi:hypothetical protein